MSDDSQCPPGVMDPLLTEHWPRPARMLLRNTLSLVVAIQTFTAFHTIDDAKRLVSAGLVALVVGCTASFTNRRRGDAIDHLALSLVVAAGFGLHVVTGHGQVYMCGYAAVFISMWWYGLPWGLVTTALGTASVGVAAAYVGHGSAGAGLGQAAGAVGLALGIAFRRRGVLTARRNAVLAGQLRDSREAEQRNALAAERARLARELHDVLAHTLSSLSLHLESTRVLAKSRNVDAEVLARLDRAVSLARTGLDEARSAVGTLRDDALPGPARLPQLVADFGRDSGLMARFAEFGTARPLTPEARVALFRATQEALTNVAKHASAHNVEVSLTWSDAEVMLHVTDDGSGGATTSSSDGNGLRGMRERAELAGGRATAGPCGGGYAVEVRLPYAAAEDSDNAAVGARS